MKLATSAVLALGCIGLATPAHAELVFFTNGRTISIKSHRVDGAKVVITPRVGGDITLDASLIARIEPDEVPYPEPAAAPPAVVADASTEPPAELQSTLRSDPRYDPLIQTASATHGVDVTLVRAVIQVESAYQQRARSAKGAVGLMQLMPATARQYGVRGRDLYDPQANIDAGTRHLKSLLAKFPLTVALAAYNAGEGAVRRFGGIPPYAETRSYVSRILTLIR